MWWGDREEGVRREAELAGLGLVGGEGGEARDDSQAVRGLFC